MTDSADGPTLRVTVSGATDRDRLDAVCDRAERTAVVETGPTGAPNGPYAYATVDGRTALYAAVTDSTLERLLDACEEGSLPTAEAEAVTDGDGPPRPTEGPLSVGTRRVVEGCGWHPPTTVPNPVAPEVRADPESAFETVEEIGLLGRGRADAAADEPLAESWRRIRESGDDPVVVVNTADADPETRGDRLLAAAAAGRLHDAARAVAAVVGAEDVIVLAPAEDSLVSERLEAAGEWHVVAAEDDFRLGEPTMALERLEGNDRIEARRRPPGPEEWGLYGRPTAIHSPRTLLQAAELWRNPEAFDADAADPGTRLVSIGGDVAAPATVELQTDVPLSRALSAVDSPADARFAVGGRFGGVTRSLDVPVSAPALAAAGLGSEGVVEVLGPDRCVVASVGERAAFAREENCGRCVPCREGSKQLHEALRAVYDGEFDAAAIRELSRVMATTSLCEFGETAARPVRTALEDFEGEFRAHADGRCPAGACGGMQ
jgi:NADH-quinone oxidoreductase subunit F